LVVEGWSQSFIFQVDLISRIFLGFSINQIKIKQNFGQNKLHICFNIAKEAGNQLEKEWRATPLRYNDLKCRAGPESLSEKEES
jgi:hypothetical protein